MQEGRPAIVCTSISKNYAGHAALADVSFTAYAGHVTGLLGPNGAGKTTLIRILTTILQPSAGTFQVAGFGPDQVTEIKSVIGVMPESAGYPKRTRAIDLLTYHGRLYGAGREEAEFNALEMLEAVGLSARRADRIGTFSRGMRQRLGLARALMNDPRIVFLDEPTLGLDPAGQHTILKLIDELAAGRDVAVLLSSHLLAEIQGICDRAVILDHGRVVFDAEPTQGLSEIFHKVTT